MLSPKAEVLPLPYSAVSGLLALCCLPLESNYTSRGCHRPPTQRMVQAGATPNPGARKRLSFLLTAVRAKSTNKKYNKAVASFLRWLSATRQTFSSYDQLDRLLAQFFHILFLDRGGTGKGVASATLYGVVALLPAAKFELHSANAALRGFIKCQPAVRHPPITWPLAVTVAVQLTQAGLWRFAAGVLLAFHCLLRVGELVNLRCADIAFPNDPRLGYSRHSNVFRDCCAALRLRQTKTGSDQWVTVTNRGVASLLFDLTRGLSAERRVFPFSTMAFRHTFVRSCVSLGLGASGYVPHSLRHGGATELFLGGARVEDIMLRGRWASTKSARHYIQAGPALLLSVSVPPDVAGVAALFARDPFRFIALAQRH